MPPHYLVPFTSTPPPIDGSPFDSVWSASPWTSPFVDIISPSIHVPLSVRMRLLHTSSHLYVSTYIPSPHIFASITTPNTPIFHDPDFEIFLDPSCSGTRYWEFEVNALGTVWQLMLDRPYYLGGTAVDPCELDGLQVAVKVDGEVNRPDVEARGWGVTVGIRKEDVVKLAGKEGRMWRMNTSHVHWEHKVEDGQYKRVPDWGTELKQGEAEWHPERNLVWAPTGVLDIHRPDKWGSLEFAEQGVEV